MTKIKTKKRRLVKTADKPIKPESKPLKKNKKNNPQKTLAIPKHDPQTSSESDTPEPNADSIQTLLEPYTKDQLIGFLIDAAVKTPSISSRIHEAADRDISHRKIFVHGLSWDTTRETLVSAFEPFGEIEVCNVVTDRVTGKAKGFGFVIFKSRKGTNKALREPKKRIGNRIVSCQLASVGPVAASDSASRKIYVSNVQQNAESAKLREFFEKFGEIEIGPLGFDVQTGKSRGFALFVYKNQEGAKKALEEPYKMFDGHQLHCQMAVEGKNSKGNYNNASVTTVMQPVPSLAAVAAAQNLALFGQQQGLNSMLGQQLGLNSMYGGLFANPTAGLLNPLLAQGVIGANQIGQMGMGLGGYARALASQGMGSLGGSQSLLGTYSGSTTAPVLQGLHHAYPGSSMGHASTSKASGSFSGYPSYMWGIKWSWNRNCEKCLILLYMISRASNGLGIEIACVLALRGVHVVMGVRNVKAGEKVKEEILQKIPISKIDVMEIDLNSLASVRKFASEYISSCFPLNILMDYVIPFHAFQRQHRTTICS